MLVTARNFGCRTLNNFFPALRYSPSAPNDSAARAFCSGDRVLRVPNQVNESRIAAIVVRSRWAAGLSVDDRVSGSSITVLIKTPLVEIEGGEMSNNFSVTKR